MKNIRIMIEYSEIGLTFSPISFRLEIRTPVI